MFSVPFATYDFLGYLSCGAVTIGALQLLTGFPPVFGHALTPFDAGAAVLAIYVAGQVTATPAKAVLEDWLVHRLLGAPSHVLFQSTGARLRRHIFPGYYKLLAAHTRARCIDRALAAGVTETGESLFQLARFSSDVTGHAPTLSRLEIFVGQYGFARNMAFACLVFGSIMLIGARWTHAVDAVAFGVCLLFTGVVFVYRFLKFYRLYSQEVFSRFGSV